MKARIAFLLAFALMPVDILAGEAVRAFVPREIVNPEAYYPEGPQLLPGGEVLVAEMPKNRVVKVFGGGVEVVLEQPDCGPTSVKHIPSSGYWILCHLGHRVLRVNEGFEISAVIDRASSGRRITWPNDASVDKHGNVYLSSSGQFSLTAPAEGRVIRIDLATNKAVELADGIRYSNGVLVRKGRQRLLVSEHLNRRILEFDLAADGSLHDRRIFFDFAMAPPVEAMYGHSGPDGMAQFEDGSIIVADYGNGRLLHLSADGRYLSAVNVSLKFVTNVAITRDEKSLFVLMTRDNSSRELDGIVQRFEIK